YRTNFNLGCGFNLVLDIRPGQIKNLALFNKIALHAINRKFYTSVLCLMDNFDAASDEDLPTLSDFYNLKGICYRYLNNFDEAERCFIKSFEICKNNFSPVLNLGKMSETRNDNRKAVEYFSAALKIAPESGDIKELLENAKNKK
ncbi:MAG: tetratricopeptide repeat protein, partial [Candidatus Saganbacteria bacterium]|nr:tetratricopeptide repeat protein [Candidatus Saganbacteria bacterium]